MQLKICIFAIFILYHLYFIVVIYLKIRSTNCYYLPDDMNFLEIKGVLNTPRNPPGSFGLDLDQVHLSTVQGNWESVFLQSKQGRQSVLKSEGDKLENEEVRGYMLP